MRAQFIERMKPTVKKTKKMLANIGIYLGKEVLKAAVQVAQHYFILPD